MGRRRKGSVWMEKRKGKYGLTYLVRWEVHGDRDSEAFPTKESAQIKLGNMREKIKNNQFQFEGQGIPWIKFTDAYIEAKKKDNELKEITILDFSGPTIRKFGDFFGQDRMVQ